MNENSSNRTKRNWQVVPFAAGDLYALESFFKRFHVSEGRYGSAAIFRWRTIENYIMPGIINLIKDRGRIIACLSNTPKKILVGGRSFLVAEIGDAMTDPAYRRQGMLSLLTHESVQDALDRGIDGVYSTPSQTTPSLSVFVNTCNFLPYPGLSIRSMFFPVDMGALLGGGEAGLIRRSGNRILKWGVSLWVAFLKIRVHPSGIELKRLHTIPETWDKFWTEASAAYDLIFFRDKETLTYRYIQNPERYTVYALYHGEEICGYAVYRIQRTAKAKILTIADFLMHPKFEPHFIRLLLRIYEDAQSNEVNYINTWCIKGSRFYRLFLRAGYISRTRIFLIWFQNKFAEMLQQGFSKWHFTMGDSDNI